MAERTVRIVLRDATGLVTRVVDSATDDPLVQRIGELERENIDLHRHLGEAEQRRVHEMNRLRSHLAEAEQRRADEVARLREAQSAESAMLNTARDGYIDQLQWENRHLRATVATLQGLAQRAALNGARIVVNTTRLAGQALGTIESALQLDQDPYDETPPPRRRKERPTMDANELAINRFVTEVLHR